MSALKKKGGVKSASLLAVMLTALLAFVGVGSAGTAFATGSSTTSIGVNQGSLSDHECNSSEWHFVITQIASDEQAPASISVTFDNGKTISVSLDKVTGGTAHYATTQYLDSKVVSATADIYEGWSGKFNLSHGPCGSTSPPTPTEIPIPGTSTKEVCGPENDQVTAGTGEHFSSTVSDWVKNSDGTSTKTVTYKADEGYVFANGETQYSDSYTDQNTECPPPPATEITNPTITLTGVCGVNNDTVAVSHSEDYTSSEPVWSNSRVSVTFTIKEGVNKVFENGKKSITISKDEVNTEDCTTPPPPPTEITNPDFTLTGVCDINNDVVTPSTSEDYTNGEPVWHDSMVSVTFTIKDGVNKVFENGEKSITITKQEVNTDDCSQQPPTEIPIPGTSTKEVCGPENDQVTAGTGEHFSSTVSDWVKNSDGTSTKTVTYKADEGYVFANGETQYSDSYTDQNTECPPPPAKTLDDVTIAPACGYVSVTNPKSNPTVTVYYGSFDQMEPDGTVDVKPGKTVKIKTTRTSLDGMVWADGYEALVFENVKVEQNCTKTPPHTTPQPPHHNPPVVTPHPPVNHHTTWTPPTKQRTSGGNTGIDTVAISQMATPSLGKSLGTAGVALVLILGFGLAMWRRPRHQPRHVKVQG